MSTKPAWLFRQSAAIPFREVEGVLEIVLITARSADRWTIPKGVVDRGLSPEESAAKEALEEAGVVGQIIPHLVAEYQYAKWGGMCTVQVFPLAVTELLAEWEESHHRERITVEAAKAVDLVNPTQTEAIRRFIAWRRGASA